MIMYTFTKFELLILLYSFIDKLSMQSYNLY